jgi:hypothetical protein
VDVLSECRIVEAIEIGESAYRQKGVRPVAKAKTNPKKTLNI